MISISLSEHFSKARLTPYYDTLAIKKDKNCLAYYFQMLDASSRMLAIFHLIEVILRNRLNIQIESMATVGKLPLRGKITPEWWFKSVTDGYPKSHCKVVNLGNRRKPLATADDYIAQLDFGYYVYLLHDRHANPAKKYSYIWQQGALQRVFPGATAKKRTRNGLFGLLRQCDDMRNRLCHHEPMWKGRYAGKEGGYENIRQKFILLFEILGYLSPEMGNIVTFTELAGFADTKQLFVSRCKDRYTSKLGRVNVLP